jgi:hypothetical protein
MSVRCVATEDWARTLVQGLGTDSHSGVPAFVLGRLAAWPTRPGACDVMCGREPAWLILV